MLEWAGNVFLALTLAGCAIMMIAVLTPLYQLRNHRALRVQGLAREEQGLAHPLPEDHALPHVVVQIPSFNEGALVERSITAAARLDWPKDKLHIQVCDDSTDETTAFARAAAARARADGIDAVVLHRGERRDFKAGALRDAMTAVEHDYFAILDVDYLAPPDFLRRCMAVLLADPQLAFVQARVDFFNSGDNWLTRAQRMMLDFHYGIEQATRSWSQQVVPFNGTCGIWRRAAIEAADGWHGDTLAEDFDLSYRAWLKGWRGTYVTSVTVLGELPTRVRAWTAQQRRWAAGFGEVAVRTLPALFRGQGLSAGERWGAIFPLAVWFGHVTFAATIVLAIIAMLLKPSAALWLGLTVYVVLIVTGTVLLVAMRWANRMVRPGTSFWRFYVDFFPVCYLMLYTSWANFRSLPSTFLGRGRIFERTPKTGAAAMHL
jgi:cellulose synthase/poly-beta-1,6-N-acetylglucosamine synthase-like glycosyltransferase